MDVLFQLLVPLTPMLEAWLHDVSPGRIAESFVLLWVIWRKLRPHLTKIEDRIAGVEKALLNGFNDGEIRFQRIEADIEKLKSQGGKYEENRWL